VIILEVYQYISGATTQIKDANLPGFIKATDAAAVTDLGFCEITE